MLNDGPLRLITQGQEISPDVDEKTLIDFGFKDLQLVFVSQGAASRSGGIHSNKPELPPFPGKDRMPMNILLTSNHFEQLFSLMQSLSDMRLANDSGVLLPHPKAQILSRRVWDILMLLPTNSRLKEALQNISDADEATMKSLLNPESPQKLMYTLYIVDWLGRPARLRRHSGLGDPGALQDQTWIHRFIQSGGLKHLFNIFLTGPLQTRDGTVWCEWKQDCLSSLLKLLVQFGVDPQDYEALADQLMEGSAAPRKRLRRYRGRKGSGAAGVTSEKLLVPRLSRTMLDLLDVDTVMTRMTNVLIETSCAYKDQHVLYKTGLFGRAQVVHFAISLLVSWVFSDEDGIESALFSSNGLPAW